MAVSSMTSSPCIHNVFQLELLLETFDGLDYVLSKDVADDMTRKARLTTCNECKKAYECQIAIYYRIGFGLARDIMESDRHRKLSGLSEFEFNEKLQNLETIYGTRMLPTDIVEKELGIVALVGIDLVEQYQFTGRITAAANATRNAIEARELEFGKDSLSTAKLKATQAQIYKAQGFISKAEQVQHDVVSIYSKKFGEEDGFTLEANSVLGLIIATQGSLMSAEQILRKVTSKFEAGLSMQHPQTLFALQHLGTTLYFQGRYEDAAEIFRKITDVRRETLGELHLLTIKAQIDLASALQGQGLLNDADTLMREISQKGSHVGDPIITSVISLSLVDLYAGQGSMDLARNSAFRARNLLEQQLGDQDPLVWSSLESEAMVWGAKAEFKREEELIRKSISAKESLGDSSMSTLNSKISLSANLMRQAMLEESRAEIEGVIERLGDDFSFAPESVFRARDLLAQCLWLLGEKVKAESEHQKLLNSFRNSFGDNHPLTLKAVKSFAAFYQGQSRWQDSIVLVSTFLDACRTTGKLAGAAIDLSTQLVLAYRERNQYRESISLCEEAIGWSIQTVGPKHNDTLALKNLLAGTYFYMGQAGKAEQLFQILMEEVAGRYMEMYVVSNLADVKTQQKDIGKAKELLERVIDLAQRWKDKGHPDVIKAKGSLLGLRLNHERVTKELLDEVDENVEEKIKLFGLNHPTTFKTITDKADALLSVGDLDGSRALYDQLENLDTVNILQNKLRYATYVAKLANAFFHRKDFEKCEQLEREAFEIRKQVLEPDSPAILTSMANLASVLCQQGKLEEAETFMKHVATVRCERDGRESLLSLDAMNDLASIYYLKGRLQESVAIFKENLEISERIGVESPQAILNRQAQLSQAQRALRERLSMRTE
ncbi:hypothetical protein B0O99DRAFT_550326 [Bisporella sp. PMI_857]|nr:hypothetical protein B0O99DRAFT_550326 [Bisporella sp. PMI_857]